jgi:hypothetical protein
VSFIREQFEAITVGIDKTEGDTEHGWWETSSGAEFGADVKGQLEHLLHQTWLAGAMGLQDPYPPVPEAPAVVLPRPGDYTPAGIFCRNCRRVH